VKKVKTTSVRDVKVSHNVMSVAEYARRYQIDPALANEAFDRVLAVLRASAKTGLTATAMYEHAHLVGIGHYGLFNNLGTDVFNVEQEALERELAWLTNKEEST